jgi:hypothetical protein
MESERLSSKFRKAKAQAFEIVNGEDGIVVKLFPFKTCINHSLSVLEIL